MSLPKGYKKGIPRVSSIVSFFSPFEGTEGEKRYKDWLLDNVPPKRKRGFAIDEKEYIKEACDVGTFVHLQMEKKALNQSVDYFDDLFKLHFDEISGGLRYIEGLNEQYPNATWEPEQVVCDEHNRFQGTIDLIRIDEETKEVFLYDWKTWGIAKKEWGLPNVYRKPYDKLKKLAIQLSLYAETYKQKGYTIGGIYGVYLHKTGCYEYKLDHKSTEYIDELLDNYNKNNEKTI